MYTFFFRWQWYDSTFLDFANWNNGHTLDVLDNKNCYAISGYRGMFVVWNIICSQPSENALMNSIYIRHKIG